jgi:hypothetical protein
MKRSRNIVHDKEKRPRGRPRSISDDNEAKAIGVRLRPGIHAHIERLAETSGRRKGDIIRELVEEALAGRNTDGMKRKRG